MQKLPPPDAIYWPPRRAFAKLKYLPSSRLPSLIAEAAVVKINELSPQNLSNLVWSFVYMVRQGGWGNAERGSAKL